MASDDIQSHGDCIKNLLINYITLLHTVILKNILFLTSVVVMASIILMSV